MVSTSNAADAGGVSQPVYRVTCPHCRALLFVSQIVWHHTTAPRGIVAIKCWRCRRVVGLTMEAPSG